MIKPKILLSIDKKVLEAYRKYCAERGMKISSKVELFMKEELKNDKSKN